MPRRIIALAALIAAALTLTACGDSHESLMKESVGLMKDMNKTLASVTDAESAEAAKGDLEDLAEQGKDIEKRMQALGDPTEEQMKAMMESVDEAEFERLTREIAGHQMRIMLNPELAKHMIDMGGGGPMLPGMGQ